MNVFFQQSALRVPNLNELISAVRVKKPSSAEWDKFSYRCSASHLCARANAARYRLAGRSVRYFEFYAGGSKVGQCALSSSVLTKSHEFIDCIQLLPRYKYLWKLAMQEVLREMGPGRYRYGSHWNLEAPRQSDLCTIDGVTIRDVSPHVVQAVEFGQWNSWDEYKSEISRNVLENAAKALSCNPQRHLFQGSKTVAHLAAFLSLRRDVAKRKAIHFSPVKATMRFIGRSLIYRHTIWMDSVRLERKFAAMGIIIQHGSQFAFVDAASHRSNGGGAWLMTLNILHDCYHRIPNGTFVIGADEFSRTARKGWADLNRSRQSCRVSHFPSSIICFTYS